MSETVQWNGQTLYAPIIACRPVRFEDYTPEQLVIHKRVTAGTGAQLNIYPGSVYQPCGDCGIEIAVGPRQQAAVEAAAGVGLAAHVVCMICGGVRASAPDATATPMSLGNPFKKAQP